MSKRPIHGDASISEIGCVLAPSPCWRELRSVYRSWPNNDQAEDYSPRLEPPLSSSRMGGSVEMNHDY